MEPEVIAALVFAVLVVGAILAGHIPLCWVPARVRRRQDSLRFFGGATQLEASGGGGRGDDADADTAAPAVVGPKDFSLLSQILYVWNIPLVLNGWRETVTQAGLPTLKPKFQSKLIGERIKEAQALYTQDAKGVAGEPTRMYAPITHAHVRPYYPRACTPLCSAS